MTEAERLIREVTALRETIRREWFAIDLDALTVEQQAVIRKNIKHCHSDIAALLDRLWILDGGKSDE